eukprot:TRINITY_DN3188_c0_g1_i1.p1 TRINITY_DN3188_c0_g1~~TRINITY_DN3188_c0_g1_i1.p1  ORF type:complete len:298 (+),score=74.65 TRINITY_DN3188_c0_g1_i1:207-1100(+)
MNDINSPSPPSVHEPESPVVDVSSFAPQLASAPTELASVADQPRLASAPTEIDTSVYHEDAKQQSEDDEVKDHPRQPQQQQQHMKNNALIEVNAVSPTAIAGTHTVMLLGFLYLLQIALAFALIGTVANDLLGSQQCAISTNFYNKSPCNGIMASASISLFFTVALALFEFRFVEAVKQRDLEKERILNVMQMIVGFVYFCVWLGVTIAFSNDINDANNASPTSCGSSFYCDNLISRRNAVKALMGMETALFGLTMIIFLLRVCHVIPRPLLKGSNPPEENAIAQVNIDYQIDVAAA